MDILKPAVLLTHTKTDKHGLSWITLKISASTKSAISAAKVLFLLEQGKMDFTFTGSKQGKCECSRETSINNLEISSESYNCICNRFYTQLTIPNDNVINKVHTLSTTTTLYFFGSYIFRYTWLSSGRLF
jgi:hypothetical protein